MAVIPIDEDATIADILGRLNKPEDYVRSVLANAWNCKRKVGSASVRIGITGEGRAPNYRLEYTKDGMSCPAVFEVYNGLSHKSIAGLGQWNVTNEEFARLFEDTPSIAESLSTPEHPVDPEHWSRQVMTLEDVSALIGKIRSRKR